VGPTFQSVIFEPPAPVVTRQPFAMRRRMMSWIRAGRAKILFAFSCRQRGSLSSPKGVITFRCERLKSYRRLTEWKIGLTGFLNGLFDNHFKRDRCGREGFAMSDHSTSCAARNIAFPNASKKR